MGWVIGADECGFGSCAGPLMVGAALVDENWSLAGLTDSKALSRKARARLDRLIREDPSVRFTIEASWPAEIDQIGVGEARRRAFARAILSLLAKEPTAKVLVDGQISLVGFEYRCEPKADLNYQCVSAASVVAKEEHDRYMRGEAHAQWPEYHFDDHVGYQSKVHLEALAEYGPCPIHRRSYAPVRRALETKRPKSPYGPSEEAEPLPFAPDISVADEVEVEEDEFSLRF